MKVDRLNTCICTAAACLAILLVTTSPVLSQPDDSDMLDLVRQGTKTAVSAIRHGRGNVTIVVTTTREDGGVSKGKLECAVAWSGNRYRLSTDSEILRNDPPTVPDSSHRAPIGSKVHREMMIDGGQLTHLDGRNATIGIVNDRGSRASALHKGFMADLGMERITFTGNGLADIQLIEQAEASPIYSSVVLRVLGREVLNDSECIVVEIVSTGASSDIADKIYHIWVDPSKGFTLSRVRMYYEGGPYSERTLGEESNVETKDYGSGAWYPVHIVRDHYRTGESGKSYKYVSKEITYASDFEINVPLTEAELSLKLPSGTRVRDESLEATYTVP